MKTTWTVVEKSKGELKVTINGEVWVQAQEKAFDKLAKNVEVDGFRKGQAPKGLAKRQVSEQNILMEAVDEVAQAALITGLKEHDLSPIARPELGLDTITAEEVTMTFTIQVKPEVKLATYKGLEVKKEEVTVSAEEVDAKVAELREQFAELVLKETGNVEDKDTAVIDFEGFKDGEAFEGGKGENYALEIGSNSFIPGFEEQVIGMGTNEEKEISLSFPENYGAEQLAGQAVVFKVKVNEIKQRELPEVNDEFAKEANQEGVETLADLKSKFETELIAEKSKKAEDDANNQLLTLVVDASEVDIPEILIEEETDSLLEDFHRRIESQGFNMEQFSQITGQKESDLREQMKVDAANKVKVRLVLDEIAKQENIGFTDEEIEHEYQEIAAAYGMEIDKVKELASVDTIGYDLRLRKAFNIIRESAKQ